MRSLAPPAEDNNCTLNICSLPCVLAVCSPVQLWGGVMAAAVQPQGQPLAGHQVVGLLWALSRWVGVVLTLTLVEPLS